jgi:hypothetical protein
MQPVFGLVLALAALTASSAAFAQRTVDPRAIERPAVQVQVQEAQSATISPPTAPPQTSSAVLAANAAWAPTGIEVKAGDQIQISAEGRWAATNPRQLSANVTSFVGPDGYPQTAGTKGLVLESANYGALIGRVGETGTPFLIGASFTGAAESDGPLFVAMNDLPGQYQDNVGRLSISVSVTPLPPPPPVTPPAPTPERPAAEAATPEPPADVSSDDRWWTKVPVLVLVAAALGVLVALGLVASALFSPRPRGRGGRDGDASGAPTVTARIANDGMRAQMIAISMRGGS